MEADLVTIAVLRLKLEGYEDIFREIKRGLEMKCGKCGNFISISLIPYQRIHRDKTTGHWVPSPGVCQCDPDDIGLWGLIRSKEAYDKKEREKQGRVF